MHSVERRLLTYRSEPIKKLFRIYNFTNSKHRRVLGPVMTHFHSSTFLKDCHSSTFLYDLGIRSVYGDDKTTSLDLKTRSWSWSFRSLGNPKVKIPLYENPKTTADSALVSAFGVTLAYVSRIHEVRISISPPFVTGHLMGPGPFHSMRRSLFDTHSRRRKGRPRLLKLKNDIKNAKIRNGLKWMPVQLLSQSNVLAVG